MGFDDEAEQSYGRPCRQSNGRSKQTYEPHPSSREGHHSTARRSSTRKCRVRTLSALRSGGGEPLASKPFDKSTGHRCQKIARQTTTMKALSRSPTASDQANRNVPPQFGYLLGTRATRGFGTQPSTWLNGLDEGIARQIVLSRPIQPATILLKGSGLMLAATIEQRPPYAAQHCTSTKKGPAFLPALAFNFRW
jgi:hypothetical protein